MTHPDMRGQIGSALAAADDIIEEASVPKPDIPSLRFFTADFDA